MSVHDEPDFARVYDEDELIEVRKGDLRALLDVATTSMDFGSGFLNDEEVEIIWKISDVLGVDKKLTTPDNYRCKLAHGHEYKWETWQGGLWYCKFCRHTEQQ